MAEQGLIRRTLSALLGVSAYQPEAPAGYPRIDDASTEAIRSSLGGNIQPLPTTRVRWYIADLETITHEADMGSMASAAWLYRTMRQDGTLAGLLSQRSDGLVGLPKKFYGNQAEISELEALNGTRSVFDEMCPPSELSLLVADGIMLGVGVGELVPVEGRDYPVLVRLAPEFLIYRWAEGQWYYRSIAGMLPITPGDGRWVLHVPGGRLQPWQTGMWSACGRAFITKQHAIYHRANYGAKLANPARWARSPLAATEGQRRGFLASVIAWGVNTVFELPPGYEVGLLESNGRGYEVFKAEIEDADRDLMIALAGQIVTVTGGSGFANADIHKSIRADLIKASGDALAYTVNTQIIPPWAVRRFGIGALTDMPNIRWDTSPPKDRKAEADSLEASAKALLQIRDAFAAYGMTIDAERVAENFGVPIDRNAQPLSDSDADVMGLEITPTDLGRVIRVDEIRRAYDLPPMGDMRGAMTLSELEALAKMRVPAHVQQIAQIAVGDEDTPDQPDAKKKSKPLPPEGEG